MLFMPLVEAMRKQRRLWVTLCSVELFLLHHTYKPCCFRMHINKLNVVLCFSFWVFFFFWFCFVLRVILFSLPLMGMRRHFSYLHIFKVSCKILNLLSNSMVLLNRERVHFTWKTLRKIDYHLHVFLQGQPKFSGSHW